MSCVIFRHSRCASVTALTLVMIVCISAFGADDLPLSEPATDHLDVCTALPAALGEGNFCLDGTAFNGLCFQNPTQPLAIRPGDEVWLISSRHLNCPSGHDVCVHRYECGVGFVPSSYDEYFDTPDSNATVTMYVHGNRVDAQTACDRGCTIYSQLAREARADQRLCHVIWSWPSTTIPGPVRDARVKAQKTYLQSYILADFVSRHDCQTRISLIGFSYGGRIIIGAQHLLGGGGLCGRVLADGRCEQAPKTRVAVWAPAVPADWLHPEGLNGRALAAVDRMLLYYNSRDSLLRFYRKKLNESHTDALGYRGICCQSLGNYAAVFEQYNVAKTVGSQHRWTRYMASRQLIGQTVHFSLWCDDK